MDERIEKWLYDVLIAIDEINSYFTREPKTFASFQQNQMLKRALKRDLEIIGEAINRILAREPGIAISNARKIVNLRNLVIHSYDNLSDENIWAIVINHLPALKGEIDELLSRA
jgi:uncharacterized protein with HEPN domain